MRHTILSGHVSGAGAVAPPLYRINDEVEFAIDIHEIVDGKLVPYA